LLHQGPPSGFSLAESLTGDGHGKCLAACRDGAAHILCNLADPARRVLDFVASSPSSPSVLALPMAARCPFVSAAACFLIARALKQIKADIAYSNVNVKRIDLSSGVAF